MPAPHFTSLKKIDFFFIGFFLRRIDFLPRFTGDFFIALFFKAGFLFLGAFAKPDQPPKRQG